MLEARLVFDFTKIVYKIMFLVNNQKKNIEILKRSTGKNFHFNLNSGGSCVLFLLTLMKNKKCWDQFWVKKDKTTGISKNVIHIQPCSPEPRFQHLLDFFLQVLGTTLFDRIHTDSQAPLSQKHLGKVG